MATRTPASVLTEDDLRPIDRALLDYMTERPVTPAYAKQRYEDEHGREYTRGYVQERLARLVEHEHAENEYGVGSYRLIDDPRQE